MKKKWIFVLIAALIMGCLSACSGGSASNGSGSNGSGRNKTGSNDSGSGSDSKTDAQEGGTADVGSGSVERVVMSFLAFTPPTAEE